MKDLMRYVNTHCYELLLSLHVVYTRRLIHCSLSCFSYMIGIYKKVTITIRLNVFITLCYKVVMSTFTIRGWSQFLFSRTLVLSDWTFPLRSWKPVLFLYSCMGEFEPTHLRLIFCFLHFIPKTLFRLIVNILQCASYTCPCGVIISRTLLIGMFCEVTLSWYSIIL